MGIPRSVGVPRSAGRAGGDDGRTVRPERTSTPGGGRHPGPRGHERMYPRSEDRDDIRNDDVEMPDLDDIIDDTDARTRRKRQKAAQSPSRPSRGRNTRKAPEARTEPQEAAEDDGWRIDKKTGKRYKLLAAATPEMIKANKSNHNSGLGIDEARKLIPLDKDFDVDDLDSAADIFMSHLRVPPSKDELRQARDDLRQKRHDIAERNRARRHRLDS